MSVSIELQHLPADVLGLPDWARPALAQRPRPSVLPELILPSEPDQVPERGSDLSSEARAELAEALEGALTRFEPHVRVLESVRVLADGRATIVLAGQQPGFLGGPLLHAFKALTAIKLARELEQLRGAPVIPAFWNHADDHDIAEVHHLWIQNPSLDLRKIPLAGASSGRRPLSRFRFDEERHRLGAIAELLRQNLWAGDEREKALEVFLPRAGESFSNAFTRVLLSLFGHHGLLVIEPDWIRAPLSRALARVVATDVRGALERGSTALLAAGMEPAIDPETAALLFHVVDERRHALRFAEDGFRYDDEAGSRTGTELAAEIVQEPADWSAGALLRPIVQDLVLPVVAYVGGWGELAYHAQLPPLRAETGAPSTAFVPRLSGTVVDSSVRESLEKLGLSVQDALEARGVLGETEPEESSDAGARLREIAVRASAELLAQRAPLSEIDRGLAQQTKKLAAQVVNLVEKLAAKADRVEANTKGTGKRHFRRINNGLFPRVTPQERVRGPLEIVARHGTEWLDLLLDEIEPLPTEHVAVNLREE